jgi:hypothetical protein
MRATTPLHLSHILQRGRRRSRPDGRCLMWVPRRDPNNVMATTSARPGAAVVRTARSFTGTGVASDSSTTSQRGARSFFEWLEGRFGGGPLPMADDTADDPQVVVTSNLTANDLRRLFRHEITVLQVRNFYPKASATALGRDLTEQALARRRQQQKQEASGGSSSTELKNWKVSTARGLESSDVFTLGAHLPYNIAVAHGEDGVREYFAKVPAELRERRRSSVGDQGGDDVAKLLWPLDQLRLELDEAWPGGAGLAKERGGDKRRDGRNDPNIRTMGGGLPRIMMGPTRWSKGFVHVDELGPLSTDSGLFSANIYLQLPTSNDLDDDKEPRSRDESQQVLEIWPLLIRNRWDWYRVRNYENMDERLCVCLVTVVKAVPHLFCARFPSGCLFSVVPLTQNAKTLSYLSSQDAEGQVILRRALRRGRGQDGMAGSGGTENENGSLRVTVEPGDLVMFCAQRPHCAIGFDSVGAVRVSLQVFCQYDGPDKRLSLEG